METKQEGAEQYLPVSTYLSKLQTTPLFKKYINLLSIVTAQYEKQLAEYDPLQSVYKHTGLPPLVFVSLVATVGISVTLKVVKKGTRLLTNGAGLLVGAILSMKSVESNIDEKERLLTYWTLYSSLTFMDDVLEKLPLYYTTKTVFLYWLLKKGGTAVVYHRFIRPFVADYTRRNLGRKLDSFFEEDEGKVFGKSEECLPKQDEFEEQGEEEEITGDF